MTPAEFVAKWSEVTTLERATVQSHFNDLCVLLDEKTPHEADPAGEWYAFEKGVEKTGAGRGWADVWKRAHFGWEYKSKSGGRESTMARALKQLQQYALALESPPLLIVSDIDTIEIHTAFQNAVQDVHIIRLEEIANPDKLQILKWAFSEPERLRPERTRNQITAEAAGQFAELAFALRQDGHDPQQVAHFLNRILFCMFAEDAGLLTADLFTSMAEKGVEHPEHFDTFIKRLFQAMQSGGPFGTEIIDWFNGGLFDSDETIPLSLSQIRIVRDLARMDWRQIEPAIFGTLFERGLDPAKRSQLGAHYTDPDSIMRLVTPTIVQPLLAEWRSVRAEISGHISKMEKVKTKAAADRRRKQANNVLQHFLEKLRNFRILDPACGSGNFLYLALQALKDIEHRVNIEAEALGLQRHVPMVGPEAVFGIELNAYAAELARVTVWIGEIQWMLDKGYSVNRKPVLKPLDNIEQRDAIMKSDGMESDWPQANVIVGNPPFLGDKKMRGELGDEYVIRLRKLYDGRVPGGADLVTFWYAKASGQLENEMVERIGLVATNSIRGGRNRVVVQHAAEKARLFNAWSDEPWVNDGAAVRVSLICFERSEFESKATLDGKPVSGINSDLTEAGSTSANATSAHPLRENSGVAFSGISKKGLFDVDGDTARQWLVAAGNPNRRGNEDVVFPWINGLDVTRRPRDYWIVNFGELNEADASCYAMPFQHVVYRVKPQREKSSSRAEKRDWWLLARRAPNMFEAISGMDRFIVTPEVSKHRVFQWAAPPVVPDKNLVVIARDDSVSLGILHSRFHEVWALRTGTSLEDRPRYTSTTTFRTFPFPDGLTPNLRSTSYTNSLATEIRDACDHLIEMRSSWLNPLEWVDIVPEVVADFPARVIPKGDFSGELKKRTLTNLYNENPAWLQNCHQKLDEAVGAAYGWPTTLSDDEILQKLLALNLERSAES